MKVTEKSNIEKLGKVDKKSMDPGFEKYSASQEAQKQAELDQFYGFSSQGERKTGNVENDTKNLTVAPPLPAFYARRKIERPAKKEQENLGAQTFEERYPPHAQEQFLEEIRARYGFKIDKLTRSVER